MRRSGSFFFVCKKWQLAGLGAYFIYSPLWSHSMLSAVRSFFFCHAHRRSPHSLRNFQYLFVFACILSITTWCCRNRFFCSPHRFSWSFVCDIPFVGAHNIFFFFFVNGELVIFSSFSYCYYYISLMCALNVLPLPQQYTESNGLAAPHLQIDNKFFFRLSSVIFHIRVVPFRCYRHRCHRRSSRRSCTHTVDHLLRYRMIIKREKSKWTNERSNVRKKFSWFLRDLTEVRQSGDWCDERASIRVSRLLHAQAYFDIFK